MTIVYIFLSTLAIFLIVNIILTLKAGKKKSGNELTEIKSSIGTLTSTFSIPLRLPNFSFGLLQFG